MDEYSCDSDDPSIHLHIAKRILNEHCFIFKPEVLNIVNNNNIVRISFTIDTDEDIWTHDSPYVKIIQKKGEHLLGEILDIDRQESDLYPLRVGENIWFKKENIIEIINEPGDKSFNKKFNNFLTEEKVQCTGPIFAIAHEYHSSSESDSEDDPNPSESGSD
jgi:hypothetical protein